MLGRDFEDEVWLRFVFELVIWPNRLLWKDELNPRVRCAFGNVCINLRPTMLIIPQHYVTVYTWCLPSYQCSAHWKVPIFTLTPIDRYNKALLNQPTHTWHVQIWPVQSSSRFMTPNWPAITPLVILRLPAPTPNMSWLWSEFAVEP